VSDTTAAPVRVGVRPPLATFGAPAATLHDFVRAVEEAGLDHLCVGDHVSFRNGQGYDGLIQATALAMLSVLPVHTSVYLLPLRHPVAVARQLSSFAQLAPGRLVFGVGMGGDDPHELEVCGVDPRTRGRRMDECLTVVRGLLAGETVTLDGTVVSVREARVVPTPPQPIPVVVGGRSDAALRRAATLGDGWLGVFVGPERWADARTRVEAMAGDAGRDAVGGARGWRHGLAVWCGFGDSPADAAALLDPAMETLYRRPFTDFARYAPHGTPDDVAAALAPFVAAGCTTFNLIPVAADDARAIAGCAHVRARLQEELRP
jgi:alkanesulfonate monooxygenase SsuD/methylene tetrahydromethanopterin reductase-like flavin-dependent oxidoreductase (luciferase family)